MSRRSTVFAPLAALIATGTLVPALLVSAHATAPACPSWTDPKGDAVTGEAPANPGGQFGDPNMDIVNAGVTMTATTVSTVIKVDKLNADASDFGDEFHLDFTAGGKDLQLYADRGASSPGAGPVPSETGPGTQAGIYDFTDNKGANGKAVATYDLKASTVTITASVADLSTLAGVALTGKPMTALDAGTQDYLTGAETGVAYDDATSTLPVSLGVACGSGGTPTPTPTPTSTPTPTPAPVPAPSGDPMKELPRAGCSTVTDPKGDGRVTVDGQSTPNDPDLDITALTLRTTPTDLLAYINVDKLAAGPSTTDGHRYAVDFTFNKHVFTMSATASAHGTNAIRDAVATSGLVGKSIQLGVDAPSTTAVPPPANRGLVTSGLKATFDTTKSVVVFSLPISDIVKNGGAPFAGTLTAVDAKSQLETNVLSLLADSAPDANGTTWAVGDNKCFTVATKLALRIVKKASTRIVTAKLTSVSGAAIAGKLIIFTVNGKVVGRVKTSSAGLATVKTVRPGQTVVATFAAVPGYAASRASARA